MEQKKEVGTKDSSLSTLHNTFLFIAFLLFLWGLKRSDKIEIG